MKKYLLSFLFFTAVTNITFSKSELIVQDPQNLRSGQGTIEESALIIKPQGVYMEYELFMTFSARNLNFSHEDTLEVQLFFDLPDGAIVHDLWLWMGDSAKQAIILDKWTASTIYEDIVKRRRDPAILFKRTGKSYQYELRIFPMAGDEKRKIKITYLTPFQWTLNSVFAALPSNLLLTSGTTPKLTLLYKPDSAWHNPKITELPNITFGVREDSVFRKYLYSEIKAADLSNSLNFQLDAPLNNGIYLSRYAGGTEGYYQLSMIPSVILGLNGSRKVAILIDYDGSKTNLKIPAILNNLEMVLKTNFTSRDSFNLIFASQNIKRASSNWMPGDSTTIEMIFNSIANNISGFSSLPDLLSNGIDFINKNGKDASILLLSSSDQVGDYYIANPLIEDLRNEMDAIYPVYVVDFLDLYGNYYYFGNNYYYANEYFFSNITRLTKGEYLSIRKSSSLSNMILTSLQSLGGNLNSFDLYTTMQNGFCYGRLNLDKTDAVYLNKPIVQVGKFNGSFPFKIQVSGVFNSETFIKDITIEEPHIFQSDTLTEEVWAGNYISSLESQPQGNNIISKIIGQSVTNRVLSLYSAFIALETNDSIEVCYDCNDDGGGIIISVEDEIFLPADSLIQAYPNPFNSQVTIQVRVPASAVDQNPSFKIYNILGEAIKTFNVNVSSEKRNMKLTWDGGSDAGGKVASGIYLFVMDTPQKRYSVKLMLMK